MRLGVYEEQLAWAVLRMKHAANEWLAELLGERWAELHRSRFLSLGVDALVPVPLHWRRRLQRGYNPSAALAWGLGRLLHVPCWYHVLKRIRPTKDQKVFNSFTERVNNVKGAFWANSVVRGKHLLLVDDVMTTAATASEAAKALKKAGAFRVTVAVLARTGR